MALSIGFTALWALMCADLSGGQSLAAPESWNEFATFSCFDPLKILAVVTCFVRMAVKG